MPIDLNDGDFDEGSGTPVEAPSCRCRRDGNGGFLMKPCDGTADPEHWDHKGALRPMPAGKWQMQLAFKTGPSTTRWVYGQRVFDSLEAVRSAAMAKDLPVYSSGIGLEFAVLALRQGATDLSDPAQALVVTDSFKLRGVTVVTPKELMLDRGSVAFKGSR